MENVERCLYCRREARIMTSVSERVYYICKYCWKRRGGDRSSRYEKDKKIIHTKICKILRDEFKELKQNFEHGFLDIKDFSGKITLLHWEMQELYSEEIKKLAVLHDL